jgi:protein required for attachment to host cells
MPLASFLGMHKLILVADGSRARWFRVEQHRLIEHEDMVCPEHKLMDRDRYTETKTGRWDRGRLGRQTHSFDDHRNAHDREVERRFAYEIAEKTEQERRRLHIQEVVVVADVRMLGNLRGAFESALPRDVPVLEVESNLAQRTKDQIHDALVEKGIMEPRPRHTAGT